MSNTLRHLPAGKLVSLPIPQRPWSHIGVDFVTDLPNSEGNTCILVTVDRFSKSCKLIPLKGLPIALETAEHLFQHVFRSIWLLDEIVLDRGPQFISHIWKAFFKLLGISVNLSSGYHPQTNGQTERKIQELGRYLQSYCQEDQHSWNSAYSVISHCCFPGRRSPQMFQLLTTGSERARECGTQLIIISSGQSVAIKDITGAEAEPPPPEVLDQLSIYTVHEILDSWHRGGRLEYLIDWEWYGPQIPSQPPGSPCPSQTWC
ncbi:hypothetical protein M9458_056648 [Cirrhinus mrigala]|uniref:Integrase catalytic domain-containing protein n=1 Tax=Cirrhinus mrigala TaxID=683832 RepID=A0ABD0MG40_CIRMR